MSLPALLQGSYEVPDGRRLDYWTRCEHCPDRGNCRHEDEPGWIRFSIDGKAKVLIQGVVTLARISRAVHDYLECEWGALDEDIALPPRQMEMQL